MCIRDREPGSLDRAAVAEIVFNDDVELEALNAIVHPAVFDEAARLLTEAPADARVVHDIPLLVHPGGELSRNVDRDRWAGIIVVDTPVALAVDRVVRHRGMDRGDVLARVEAQATREERRAIADFVVDNSGALADLAAQVDDCWTWMGDQQDPATVEEGLS